MIFGVIAALLSLSVILPVGAIIVAERFLLGILCALSFGFRSQVSSFVLAFHAQVLAFSRYICINALVSCSQLFFPTVVNVVSDVALKFEAQTEDSSLLESSPEAKWQNVKEALARASKVLMLSNHVLYTDWFFIWALLNQMGATEAASFGVIMKDSLRRIPVIGYLMDAAGFLFLKRKADTDIVYLRKKFSQEMAATYADRCRFLIFPEGTDFSVDNLAKSNAYATLHGFPSTTHVLQPKTVGIHTILNSAQFDGVLDVTLYYGGVHADNTADKSQSTEAKVSSLAATETPFYPSISQIFRRRRGPSPFWMRIAFVPANDIPFNGPVDALAAWNRALFVRKQEFMCSQVDVVRPLVIPLKSPLFRIFAAYWLFLVTWLAYRILSFAF